MTGGLSIWTVYRNPSDMPGWYVVRRHVVDGQGARATSEFASARTLEEVRTMLPLGLTRLPREPTDEPHIVECWL